MGRKHDVAWHAIRLGERIIVRGDTMSSRDMSARTQCENRFGRKFTLHHFPNGCVIRRVR